METIKAIAMICSIYNGVSDWALFDALQKNQILCQAYYAQCIKSKKSLIDCMIERPKAQK